jgi:hypothetical protein
MPDQDVLYDIDRLNVVEDGIGKRLVITLEGGGQVSVALGNKTHKRMEAGFTAAHVIRGSV